MTDTTIDQTTTQDAPDQDDARGAIRKARELVPVGAAGVQITDLAQQVDYAQTMCRAEAALPTHLRGKVGDCLAIIDISSRAGLSPYMVANKTYIGPDGRLGFESQLYHAFAQASGLLKGDLDVAYEGDGDDVVCVVTGVLKSDPTNNRVHRSPKLKDLHPGYSVKRRDGDGTTAKKKITYVEGQKMKAEGKVADGTELFAAGSPLWNRKPQVQMFYDTSRDWIRIHAPRATLGIYTIDELEEYGPDFARDVTPPSPGLGERLRAGNAPKTGEGFSSSDAAADVEKAKNGGAHPDEETAGAITPDTAIDAVGLSDKTVKTLQGAKVEKLADLLMMTEDEVRKLVKKAGAHHVVTVVGKHGFALRVDGPSPAQEAEKEAVEPKNVAQWKVYCLGWIKKEESAQAIRKRWDVERKLRNECGVTSDDRDPIQVEMVARCKELGE